MTLARYLVPFVLMAVATATILTVGVLGAAGLLHRPRAEAPRDRAARTGPGRPR